MIKISIRNKPEIQKRFAALKSEAPFVTALALNRTARRVATAERKEMRRVFDKPTPWTMRSLVTIAADEKTQQIPHAIVKIMDNPFSGRPATDYLDPQVKGGQRKSKAFENLMRRSGVLPPSKFIMPSKDLKTNRYGNINRGLINKILSATQSQFDKAANSKKKSVNFRRFVLIKDVGIYRRDGNLLTGQMFFARKPTYRKRFDFDNVAERVTKQWLNLEINNALVWAIRNPKKQK